MKYALRHLTAPQVGLLLARFSPRDYAIICSSINNIILIYQYVEKIPLIPGAHLQHRPNTDRRSVFAGASVTDKKASSQSNTLPQLGELELAVMQSLWERAQQSASSLHQSLPPARQCSLSTVQSTLERLHRKRLVRREKRGHAYVYYPRLERAELLGQLLGGVIRKLHTGSLDPILSSFVDFADRIDDSTLDRLEELLQQRKRERQDGV